MVPEPGFVPKGEGEEREQRRVPRSAPLFSRRAARAAPARPADTARAAVCVCCPAGFYLACPHCCWHSRDMDVQGTQKEISAGAWSNRESPLYRPRVPLTLIIPCAP